MCQVTQNLYVEKLVEVPKVRVVDVVKQVPKPVMKQGLCIRPQGAHDKDFPATVKPSAKPRWPSGGVVFHSTAIHHTGRGFFRQLAS